MLRLNTTERMRASTAIPFSALCMNISRLTMEAALDVELISHKVHSLLLWQPPRQAVAQAARHVAW